MDQYFDIAAIGSKLEDNTSLAEKALSLGVRDQVFENQSVEDSPIHGV
jgi:hypothetical protein